VKVKKKKKPATAATTKSGKTQPSARSLSELQHIINPPGRPSDYTKELGEAVCSLISEGWSLRRVCMLDEMPSKQTVFRWLRQFEEFRDNYVRACEERAESHADETIDIADEATDRDSAAAAKVRVDARKWYTAVTMPRKYSPAAKIEHAGKVETTPANFILNFGGAPKDQPKEKE